MSNTPRAPGSQPTSRPNQRRNKEENDKEYVEEKRKKLENIEAQLTNLKQLVEKQNKEGVIPGGTATQEQVKTANEAYRLAAEALITAIQAYDAIPGDLNQREQALMQALIDSPTVQKVGVEQLTEGIADSASAHAALDALRLAANNNPSPFSDELQKLNEEIEALQPDPLADIQNYIAGLYRHVPESARKYFSPESFVREGMKFVMMLFESLKFAPDFVVEKRWGDAVKSDKSYYARLVNNQQLAPDTKKRAQEHLKKLNDSSEVGEGAKDVSGTLRGDFEQEYRDWLGRKPRKESDRPKYAIRPRLAVRTTASVKKEREERIKKLSTANWPVQDNNGGNVSVPSTGTRNFLFSETAGPSSRVMLEVSRKNILFRNEHTEHRYVLPSGSNIEIVRLEVPSVTGNQTRSQQHEGTEICFNDGSASLGKTDLRNFVRDMTNNVDETRATVAGTEIVFTKTS